MFFLNIRLNANQNNVEAQKQCYGLGKFNFVVCFFFMLMFGGFTLSVQAERNESSKLSFGAEIWPALLFVTTVLVVRLA